MERTPKDHEGEHFVFEDFDFWPDRSELFRDGVQVPIASKPLALLAFLIRNRDRVVSKAELLEAVWPDVTVSEAAFASALRDLRRALEPGEDRVRAIRTIRGRGLRFSAEVRERSATSAPTEEPGSSWQAVAESFERSLQALEQVWASRGGRNPARDAPAPRERRDLLVALARARWAAGDTDEARSTFLHAVELGRQAGDAEILARAALGFAGRTDVTPGIRRDAIRIMEEARAALGCDPSSLSTELLARIGTELYYDGDGSKSEQIADEALHAAERSGDPSLLAYVLTARHFVGQRPQVHPSARMPWADRAIELVGEAASSDVLALALQQRVVDHLELGDRSAFEQDFRRYSRVVGELDQPFFEWIHAFLAGTRLLLTGRIEQAERQAHAALDFGLAIGSPNARGAFAAQLLAIRRHQGRLAELAPLLGELVRSPDALPAYRAAFAAAMAAGIGDPQTTRSARDAFAAIDFGDLPHDQNWLGALAVLTPAAIATEQRVAELYELLRPFAGRIAVVGYGAAVLGAVDHHLGLLAAAQGRPRVAAEHLADARDLHRRLDAPLWIAETRSCFDDGHADEREGTGRGGAVRARPR